MALLLAAALVLGFGVFRLRARPRSPRVAQAGESFLLSNTLMEYGLWVVRPIAQGAARLRIPPDWLSWASLGFHLAAAGALAEGRFAPAAWLLLLGAAADSLDGTVARARGMASDAGEVLDAVVDRWSELAVCFGLAWHYRADDAGLLLSLFAGAGSLMVSYTRAKAQALGMEAGGGMMQRHERAAYLAAAVLAAALLGRWDPARVNWPVYAALALIATLATVASLLRVARTRRVLREMKGKRV